MSLANSLLGQNYRLIRLLGSGGTGTLYLAHDIRLEGQLALKVVPVDEELLGNSRVTQRVEKLFHDKMQAIAELVHAHIVPVNDFGHDKIDDSEYFYIAMDYCRAGSLADRLAENARARAFLTPAEIASVISQAAEALSYAHERGIVHQDIKPSNLFLSQYGSPDLRLADFGLAHFFATLSGRGLSQSSYMRGTATAIAPEQWDGQAVPASDQYALAVLAFYLLTGQFPFQGPLSQLIQQHRIAQPPAPSHFNRQLSSSIDKIIRRALAKQPEKRFPSILEFVQAFTSALQLAGDQPGIHALNVAAPSPEPVPALPWSTPPALHAAAEVPAPRDEKGPSSQEEATLRASIEMFARHEEPDPLSEEEDILRAPTERLVLHHEEKDILHASTEMLVARAEKAAPVGELVAEATALALISSSDFAASHVAEKNNVLALNAPLSEFTDDEATLLAHPPALTSDAPNILALSSEPAGDALALLMQPPELTSDAPGLLAPPPAAMGDASTVLAPGLPGAQARDARGAFPATRPASMSAAFSMALAIQPAPAALAGQPALHLKQAPVLPAIQPAQPTSQAISRRWHLSTLQRWHLSTLQKSLIICLLALVVLLGSGALLLRNLSAAGHSHTGSGWWSGQMGEGNGNGNGITIIVSPTSPDQTVVAGSTATPTTGSKSSSGATPTTGSKSSSGTTPTTGAGPAPTTPPVLKPTPTFTPTPTPTPTPPPCTVDSWSSTLSPTYAAGGTERFVTPYCNGVVTITWTSAPPSGGNEVDAQICYGMRTTNCSNWVRYTGVNVWYIVATGLSSGQGFYINSRCSSCTGSSFKIYGEIKY